jgi:flagellar basal body rod protein FlgC
MKKRRDVYRLAIVTNALDKSNFRISVISNNIADASWRDEEGNAAQVKEIIAARIFVGP